MVIIYRKKSIKCMILMHEITCYQPGVPPPASSVDPVMSALTQMMSKLNEVSVRLDRVEGAKAQCSDASTEQRKGKRVEFVDQLPSQPLANPRNLGQASSSHTHNVNVVRIDSASEEAHVISGLHNDKVLVDPHKDHKRRKDPLEEKYDQSSPMIIPEQDSDDEEAHDEESWAEPNPKVYKPPVPYPPEAHTHPHTIYVIHSISICDHCLGLVTLNVKKIPLVRCWFDDG